MRSIVTGGTGMIGSNLVEELLRQGHEVFYTGTAKENSPGGVCIGYEFDKIDWAALPPIEVVFHQAAITDTMITDRRLMMEVNCYKALDFFEQAIDHGCQQIVYASSCAVYGDVEPPFRESGPVNPLNVYGESKLTLDEEVGRLHGCPIIGLRYSNVYGPGEAHKKKSASMVYQLAEQIRSGRNPRLFQWGEQKRDFIYVKDVVQLNLAAACATASGVYNGGSGVATSFNQVVETIGRLTGTACAVEYFPNPCPASYQNLTLCDMSRTAEVLGFTPRWGLEQGVADSLAQVK